MMVNMESPLNRENIKIQLLEIPITPSHNYFLLNDNYKISLRYPSNLHNRRLWSHCYTTYFQIGYNTYIINGQGTYKAEHNPRRP